jgi:methionyl-tRNA formyltransferase
MVNSINDPTVADTVVAASPDICVITCTTILSQITIERIGVDIINIHGGHLPHYRGCHCFFFALSDGNFDQIGSTVHFIDRGIDTGDIIEVARPAMSDADNAESLYCRAEHLAAHRLSYWLGELEAGTPLPRESQPFRGRLCLRRHRRPAHDVVFAWRRWSGQLRFPTVGMGEQWQRPGIGEAPGSAPQAVP